MAKVIKTATMDKKNVNKISKLIDSRNQLKIDKMFGKEAYTHVVRLLMKGLKELRLWNPLTQNIFNMKFSISFFYYKMKTILSYCTKKVSVISNLNLIDTILVLKLTLNQLLIVLNKVVSLFCI